MSPFDLRGPEFLVFYIALGLLMLFVLFVLRQAAEPSDAIQMDLSSPYLISYLRGGKNELLRIATISLIHRGLLKVSGTKVSITAPNVMNGAGTSIERKLLSHFAKPKEASSVFSELSFDEYDADLERLGLLPDDTIRTGRSLRLVVALVVLWGVALSKIAIALSRGRSNIQFLIILSVLFGYLAYRMIYKRLTRRGESMLAGLRSLFSSLKNRASSASGNWSANELTLLGAVYGIAALPTSICPYARTLYPAAASSSDSGGDSSSSSCGSSSCGGGGGCGSGCGGCGS
jgi:uncharacterized protein (TIGR04222 family)